MTCSGHRSLKSSKDAGTALAVDWTNPDSFGRFTVDDPDGYHRVRCPAATGKVRCRNSGGAVRA
jgi:hypothetical protein